MFAGLVQTLAWADTSKTLAAASAPARFGEHQVVLIEAADGCLVDYGLPGAVRHRLPLDLKPPCRLLLWQQPPPRAGTGRHAARPLGSRGELMAWELSHRGQVVALAAVIGDPLQPPLAGSALARLRASQNMTCAGSVQGLDLTQLPWAATRKRDQVGVMCVETGMDLAGFDLLLAR